jgi:hypothetical protein
MYDSLASDLMVGVAEIGEFIGKSPRQVDYMVRNDMLPVFKVGNVWHARRSTVLAHFARLEAEALAQLHSRRDISSDAPVVANDLNTTATAM